MKQLGEKNLRILSINNMERKYIALFKNVLEFEGMDYGVKDFLMQKLLYNGQIATFNLDTPKTVDYSELAFASFTETTWKWDNTPKTIRVLNERNAPHFPDKELIVNEEAVVLKLDFIPYNFIKEYVNRLYDIQETINTNLIVHKMPFIIKSTDNKTVSAIKRILENDKIIAIDNLTFDVIEAKAPYIIDKLQLYKSETEAELLTVLGIDNVKFEKKAQMSKDEINANNEEITSYRQLIESKIESFFNQINEVLGHNLSIKQIEQDEILFEEEEGNDENVEY